MRARPVEGDEKASSRLMRMILAIRHSSAFGSVMTLIILFNCVSFVLDGQDVSASTIEFMDKSNLACLVIFTIEIFLCATADGLKAYWGSSWNKLDVFIVGMSWILDFSTNEASLSFFRILRVLKPLRLLKRIGSLQDLLQMYGLSAVPFVSVYIVLALGLLFFAVVGMQLFANNPYTFHVCTNDIRTNATSISLGSTFVPQIAPGSFSVRDHLACRPSENGEWWNQRCGDSQCRSSTLLDLKHKGRSSLSRSNFDSFGPAIFTVYCMVQLEGWSDLMYNSMHTVSGTMPVYWVVLVVVLAFGMNSLFLGVMCDLTLETRKQRMAKELAETSSFKQWLVKRVEILEQNTRRKRVANSKFSSFFYNETRYEDEEKGVAHHMNTVGARGKHFFLKEAHTKKDQYDVRKGRVGFNESLPEEMSLDRVLPKPPNLATMFKHKRSIRTRISAAVARIISYPNKIMQYEAYDPFRCAQSALKPFDEQDATAAADSSTTEQSEDSLSFFDAAFILLIVVNLGLVASSHVMQPPTFKELQLNTDIVMNSLYTCELLIRWIAYNSLFLYVKNNPFDFCVVLVSDIFLIVDSVTSISLPGVNIFRVARLLRVVKILNRIPRIRLLLMRLFETVTVSVFPCIMLLFWIFCFSLVGIQLFKNNGTVSSRLGFQSFEISYVTSFSVMTFERWLDVLDDLVSQNQSTAVIYFIFFVGVGKYLGLNGITAAVLMTFSLNDAEKLKSQKSQYNETLKIQQDRARRMSVVSQRRSSARLGSLAIANLQESIAMHDASGKSPRSDKRDSIRSLSSKRGSIESVQVELGTMNQTSKALDSSKVGNVLGLPFVSKADVSLQSSFCNAKHDVFFCMTPENSVRGIAVSIISSQAFSVTILLTILASVILLLASTPYQSNPITPSIIRLSDYVFQGIFIAEFLLKVLSTGFGGYLGYWSSRWNRLDLCIIIVCAVDLIISAIVSDVRVLRLVRVLRILRPLRLLNRFEVLQRMLSSIGRTIREDAIFLVLFFLAFFAFALFGLDLFSGSGWSCTDTARSGPDNCYGVILKKSSIDDLTILLPVSWRGYSFSSYNKGFFDDIWMSMQSLIHVMSMEGWLTIYYAAADLNIDDINSMIPGVPYSFWNGNDQLLLQPEKNVSGATFFYFMTFIVVFSFFFLQTFVATVLSNISRKSETGRLTSEQLHWYLLKIQLKRVEPVVVAANPFTSQAISTAAMINRKEFDMFVLCLFIFNISFIAATGNNASDSQRDTALYVCIAGCFCELVVLAARSFETMITAHQSSVKIKNMPGLRRLCFSLLLLILSCIEIGVWSKTAGLLMNTVRCVVGLLTVMLNLLWKTSQNQNTTVVIHSMEQSIGQFSFAIIFLSLCIVLFAIVGQTLFSGVKRGPGITVDSNFDDAPHAILLLFKIATGESWQLIQKDCSIQPPYCSQQGGENDDCGVAVAWIYFDAFFLMTRCIFLNVFTTVVLEQLYIQKSVASIPIKAQDISLFRQVWAHFDPAGKGVLPISLLNHVIHRLSTKGSAFPGGCSLLRQYPYRCITMKGFFGSNVNLQTMLRRPSGFQLLVLQAELLDSLLPGATPMFSFKDTLYILSKYAVGANALAYEDSKLEKARLERLMDRCAFDVFLRCMANLSLYTVGNSYFIYNTLCMKWWHSVHLVKRSKLIFQPRQLQ